jgi:hypothetical protein
MSGIDFTKPRVDFRRERGAMQSRQKLDFTKPRVDYTKAPDPRQQKLDPEIARELDVLLPPVAAASVDQKRPRSRRLMIWGYGSALIFAMLAGLFFSGLVQDAWLAPYALTASWAGALCAVGALLAARFGWAGRR